MVFLLHCDEVLVDSRIPKLTQTAEACYCSCDLSLHKPTSYSLRIGPNKYRHYGAQMFYLESVLSSSDFLFFWWVCNIFLINLQSYTSISFQHQCVCMFFYRNTDGERSRCCWTGYRQYSSRRLPTSL